MLAFSCKTVENVIRYSCVKAHCSSCVKLKTRDRLYDDDDDDDDDDDAGRV